MVDQPTLEVTEDEWERVFNVNVKGVYLGSQAFVARVIEQGQGGSIINISSTGASRPRPGLVWYNASKGAVSNVSKMLMLFPLLWGSLDTDNMQQSGYQGSGG